MNPAPRKPWFDCPHVGVFLLLFGVLGSLGCNGPAAEAIATENPAEDPAVSRARRQVEMLDDIYKGGIVLITEHYVNEDSDMPAGTAFKKLFEAAKKKGWHEVRLLDATGDPYDDVNAPAEGFETEAVAKLKNGESFVDQVIERDGKRYLQAATPIPVVMPKCIMCHENYDNLPDGAVIGALGYTLPIE